MKIKLELFFDKVSNILGNMTAIILIILTTLIFCSVILRYFFNINFIAAEEMQWYLCSIISLLGISYSLKENAHVRVDIFYDNLSIRKKAIINIVGTLIFLIPFATIVAFGSLEFVKDSFENDEMSINPGGLPYTWIIKALIPLSMIILIFTAIGFIIKNINSYKNKLSPEKKVDLL